MTEFWTARLQAPEVLYVKPLHGYGLRPVPAICGAKDLIVFATLRCFAFAQHDGKLSPRPLREREKFVNEQSEFTNLGEGCQ